MQEKEDTVKKLIVDENVLEFLSVSLTFWDALGRTGTHWDALGGREQSQLNVNS